MKRMPVFFTICVFFLYCFCLTAADGAEKKVFKLGALLCQSGDWASLGQDCKAALDTAIADINSDPAVKNANVSVSLETRDTRTDSTTAMKSIRDLKNAGVSVIIGPQTSSETKMIIDYANSNGIVLLCPSATSPSLAVREDCLFRFCPDDSNQAALLARVFEHEKAKAVVSINRNDLWGQDLLKMTKAGFEASGGRFYDGVVYNTGGSDYSQPLRALSAKIKGVLSAYPEPGEAVVYFVGFDEFADIFYQAGNNPDLCKLRWFGTDGISRDDKLLLNKSVADFASKTGFTCTSYSVVTDPREATRYNAVVEKITQKIGRVPSSYALIAYDIAWEAVKAYLAAGTDEASAFRKKLVLTAAGDQGITGPMRLNDNGDRTCFGYDIWGVKGENGKMTWQKIGKWIFENDGSVVFEQSAGGK